MPRSPLRCHDIKILNPREMSLSTTRKDTAGDAELEPKPLELGFFSGARAGAGAVRYKMASVPKEVHIKKKVANMKRAYYAFSLHCMRYERAFRKSKCLGGGPTLTGTITFLVRLEKEPGSLQPVHFILSRSRRPKFSRHFVPWDRISSLRKSFSPEQKPGR